MRAIDGDALDKFLEDAEIEAHKMQRYVMVGALNTIRGNLRTFPAITPERKRGRWLYASHYGERYRVCSVCSVERLDDFPTGMNYCPNCGADMRGDRNETD